MRSARGANTVPTDASASAVAASDAAASSTGTPASAASSAEDSFDAIPPVPRWLPRPATTPSRSAGPATSGMKLRVAFPRIRVVEAVDIGQQHQGVGADQMRHQRREPVVVAEPDLVGGHRVVLVDDRDRVQRPQPVQGALGVGVLHPLEMSCAVSSTCPTVRW